MTSDHDIVTLCTFLQVSVGMKEWPIFSIRGYRTIWVSNAQCCHYSAAISDMVYDTITTAGLTEV